MKKPAAGRVIFSIDTNEPEDLGPDELAEMRHRLSAAIRRFFRARPDFAPQMLKDGGQEGHGRQEERLN